MGKIDSIIATQGTQNTEIAIIRTKAEATEEHLKVLNSKVALQEGRQQATDSAVSLNAKAIEILLRDNDKITTFWERNWEKLFWFILACGWAYYMANK